MKKESGIYLITCKPTGEKYVGSACNLSRRTKEHKYALRKGWHYNYKLQAEWSKHGEDNFIFNVLELVSDKNDLLIREQFWMDSLKPELNISPLAEHPGYGIKRTQETIDRLSTARKKYLETLTPEQKDDFRLKVKLGREEWWESLTEDEKQDHIRRISNPHTDASKEKMSRGVNKAYAEGRIPLKRKPHSEETKCKIREARARQAEKQMAETARKRAEWEKGREQRELERREKLSKANKGKKISEEVKAKLRAAAQAQWSDPAYKAKHHKALKKVMGSPEMRERLSESHKGKKLSAEHCKKIGDLHRGMKRNPETKRRQSLARKRWWANRKNKK